MPTIHSLLVKIAGLLLALTTVAAAQEYPTKPIKFIVTFSPGGFVDVTARIVAQHWTERFGQSVLVENKPGTVEQRPVVLAVDAGPDHNPPVPAQLESEPGQPGWYETPLKSLSVAKRS